MSPEEFVRQIHAWFSEVIVTTLKGWAYLWGFAMIASYLMGVC